MPRIKITKQEAIQRVYDALQPRATPDNRNKQLTALLDRARRNRVGNKVQTTSPTEG